MTKDGGTTAASTSDAGTANVHDTTADDKPPCSDGEQWRSKSHVPDNAAAATATQWLNMLSTSSSHTAVAEDAAGIANGDCAGDNRNDDNGEARDGDNDGNGDGSDNCDPAAGPPPDAAEPLAAAGASTNTILTAGKSADAMARPSCDANTDTPIVAVTDAPAVMSADITDVGRVLAPAPTPVRLAADDGT